MQCLFFGGGFQPKRKKNTMPAHVRKRVTWVQPSPFTGAFCLLKPLNDDVVLWVSWQKLTFGEDIGISSILGYKKQLFSRGPRLCQMILSCACTQTPKWSVPTRDSRLKEGTLKSSDVQTLTNFSSCKHFLHFSTNGPKKTQDKHQ